MRSFVLQRISHNDMFTFGRMADHIALIGNTLEPGPAQRAPAGTYTLRSDGDAVLLEWDSGSEFLFAGEDYARQRAAVLGILEHVPIELTINDEVSPWSDAAVSQALNTFSI